MIEARASFCRRMRRWSPEKLIFIDESGVNLSQTRTHAWARRGDRIADLIPGHRETYTIIAGLRSTGVIAPMVLPGAMNTDALLAWIDRVLAPELRHGDTVVWDNIGFHNADEVRAALRRYGVRVIFLPPYSPELNPIEEAWSKLKSFLRAAKARASDALVAAIGDALKSITVSDCFGWFKHAGYAMR